MIITLRQVLSLSLSKRKAVQKPPFFISKIFVKIRFNFWAARPRAQACRNFTKQIVRRFFAAKLPIVTPQSGSRNV